VLLRLLRSKVTKNNRWLLQLAREKIFVGLSELLCIVAPTDRREFASTDLCDLLLM